MQKAERALWAINRGFFIYLFLEHGIFRMFAPACSGFLCCLAKNKYLRSTSPRVKLQCTQVGAVLKSLLLSYSVSSLTVFFNEFTLNLCCFVDNLILMCAIG